MSPENSARLARALTRAESVFDSKDKALAWLARPLERFGGKSPIEMLETEADSLLVEELLTQIDEGFFT